MSTVLLHCFPDQAMTCAYENYRTNITMAVHDFIHAVDSMDMQNTPFSGFCKYVDYATVITVVRMRVLLMFTMIRKQNKSCVMEEDVCISVSISNILKRSPLL